MSALHIRLSVVTLFVMIVLLGHEAQAQYAPTPRSAPSTPVHRESLGGKNAPSVLASRDLEGKATFTDAERLKIGEVELRLYGVVPPQMGASFGPQARAVVDSLSQGDVRCRVQDRARDGQYMAICKSDKGLDFGMELLRRGLAATARGTLQNSDLAPAYLAAEQAAQAQHIGIWSAQTPGAMTDKDIKEAVARVEAAKSDAVAKAEAAADTKIKEAAAKAEAAQKLIERADLALSAGAAAQSALPPAKPDMKMELAPTAAELQALLNPPAPNADSLANADDVPSIGAERGWLERYQLLTTGLLGLLGAFSLAGTLLVRQSREKRFELKGLAAALRGELMAARSICLARLAKINHEPDEKNVTWPRLRTLVFQAYVGRLGHLGAEMARQISSIYGQASDYASYYVGTESRSDVASKKQALQTLVHHIEEVMPRLTQVERSGVLPRTGKENPALTGGRSASLLIGRLLRPVAATLEKLPSLAMRALPAPAKPHVSSGPDPVRSPLWDALPDIKDELTAEHRSPALQAMHRAIADARALAAEAKATEVAAAVEKKSLPQKGAEDDDGTVVLKKDILQNVEPEIAEAVTRAAEAAPAPEKQAEAKVEPEVADINKEEPAVKVVPPVVEAEPVVKEALAEDAPPKNGISLPAGQKTPERHIEPVALARLEAAIAASKAAKTGPKAAVGPVAKPANNGGINFAAPIFEKLAKIKEAASVQMGRLKPQPIEDLLPDYANLTEEELEALSYAEAYLAACTPKKERKAG